MWILSQLNTSNFVKPELQGLQSWHTEFDNSIRSFLRRFIDSLETMKQESEKPSCCEQMENRLRLDCSQHEDVFDCPDALVYQSVRFDEYGLIIHDGGSSYVLIEYCPWCGTKLPESKRDLWFNKLEAMGINPSEDVLPEEYNTGVWRKGL